MARGSIRTYVRGKNSYSPNLFTYLNGKYLIFQKYVETAASYNAILFSDSIGGEWTFSELSLRDWNP